MSTRIPFKVAPGASRTEIVGTLGNAVKVRVAAPPEKGKANAELFKLVARRLGVSRSAITLVSGESAREKVLEIVGLQEETVRRRLR